MFSSHKRIFAGKSALQQAPFCPVLTNESGLISLRGNSLSFDSHLGAAPYARPSIRDGKYRS